MGKTVYSQGDGFLTLGVPRLDTIGRGAPAPRRDCRCVAVVSHASHEGHVSEPWVPGKQIMNLCTKVNFVLMRELQ